MYKALLTNTFIHSGPRRPLPNDMMGGGATKKYSSDAEHYNNDDADIEQFKERLSYLMPYSHKHGADDVLPSLQDRNRCMSVPSMTPEVKTTTTTLERQCRIFDDEDDEDDEEEDDDDGDGEKNTTLLENVVQSSALVGCSDGDDQGKK